MYWQVPMMECIKDNYVLAATHDGEYLRTIMYRWVPMMERPMMESIEGLCIDRFL